MLESDKRPLFPRGLKGKARVVWENFCVSATAKPQENSKAQYHKSACILLGQTRVLFNRTMQEQRNVRQLISLYRTFPAPNILPGPCCVGYSGFPLYAWKLIASMECCAFGHCEIGFWCVVEKGKSVACMPPKQKQHVKFLPVCSCPGLSASYPIGF